MSQTYGQHEWEKVPDKNFEKWKNFDNLPEPYKQLLKKEDNFKIEDGTLTNGTKYTYKVSYWQTSDTWSVIRWLSTGSKTWTAAKKDQYYTVKTELADLDYRNFLLQDNQKEKRNVWVTTEILQDEETDEQGQKKKKLIFVMDKTEKLPQN